MIAVLVVILHAVFAAAEENTVDEGEHFGGGTTNATIGNETSTPSAAPTPFQDPEEVHDSDAFAALALNVTLIICVLLAYHVKINKIYCLPESAAGKVSALVTADPKPCSKQFKVYGPL